MLQDSEPDSDGSISPTNSTSSHSDENISASSSTSENQWPIHGRDCHHLGHIEAIPMKRDGTLKIVFNACVEHVAGSWGIRNSNYYGPKNNICFKLPGPGNNWIASISEAKAMEELDDIVDKHDNKGYEYHWYTTLMLEEDRRSRDFIVESYLEGEDRERVPEGRQMILTLKERLGFKFL